MKYFEKFSNRQTLLAISFIALLALPLFIGFAPVNADAVPDRKTGSYIAVSPKVVGLGQEVVVNAWINPAPAGPTFYAQDLARIMGTGFSNITVTFTRPDGTKDTFQPLDASFAQLGRTNLAGSTTSVGTLRFYYKPDQVGDWSVTFTFPGQTFTTEGSNDTVYYKPSSAPPFTFTVQTEQVLAGLLNGWPWLPLPEGYWTRPINSNNREWYQISGDWLMSAYDSLATKYNPYSKGPDSAHILWKRKVAIGGLIGGDWGSTSEAAAGGTPPIIMGGKVYYNDVFGGTYNCLDLRTGELLYRAPGTVTQGLHIWPFYQTEVQVSETVMENYLWDFGTSGSWILRDPMTGAVRRTFTGVPSGLTRVASSDGSMIFYLTQRVDWNTTIPLKYRYLGLIKWDGDKVTGNNWLTGLVWNVSIRQEDGRGIGDSTYGLTAKVFDGPGVVVVSGQMETAMMGFNATTGERLWTTISDFVDQAQTPWTGGPNGPIIKLDSADNKLRAFDVTTGKQVWETVVGSYPWSDMSAYYGLTLNGLFVRGTFDGYVYAYNVTNGNLVWKSDYPGDTGETVQGTWAYGGSSYAGISNPGVAADGKIYVSTQTIYRLQPKTRFNTLFCIDAATGKYIWNVSGAIAPSAIAEGYLLGTNDNDGYMYAFGKGLTETTVSAPTVAVPKGAPILIQGTVTDQSPAQKGTPAVADESMSEWMDYLHMQNATLLNSPPTPKGVQVKLTATGPDGTTIDVGTTVTTEKGNYALSWTPPSEGIYWIKASFEGSESYWSSDAQTSVLIGAASGAAEPTFTPTPSTPSQSPTTPASSTPAPTSPVQSPTPATQPGNEANTPLTTYIAIAAIAIVSAVVAVALLLKRRAK